MRPIKFKLWHEKSKQMFIPNAASSNLLIGLDGSVKDVYLKEDITDEVIKLQYTGLKDKQGKEIYEGDIFELKHPYNKRYHKGVVEFIDGKFTCRNFYQPHFDNPTDPFSEGTKYIEIIGNIYENKELLEGK